MYYKQTHTIGIRRGFQLKNQAFSFGGARWRQNWSKDQLQALGDVVISKLVDDGMSEAEAKAYADSQRS